MKCYVMTCFTLVIFIVSKDKMWWYGLFNFLLAPVVSSTAEVWNVRGFQQQRHSLLKGNYAAGLNSDWNYGGNTLATQNYIRLTPDLSSKKGMLWNKMPVRARNWELHMHFQVFGKGKNLFGDGMAVWYANEIMQPGPVFGNTDYFNGLAIMLDTYSNHNGAHNHEHPYISAMVNNGTVHYDHDRDGTHTQLAGCGVKFRHMDTTLNPSTHIAIRYENDNLTVSTRADGNDGWKECFRVAGVRLPTGYHIGVSASTGDLSDNHDVISIHFYELDDPTENEDRSKIVPNAQNFDAPRERIEDTKTSATFTGVKTFLWMMFIAIIVVVCVVVAIMFYQKQQDKRMKRFY